MTRNRIYLRGIALGIACALPLARLAGQAPYPDSRHAADSLRGLLPDTLRPFADSALNGSTEFARMSGYIPLLETPDGAPFAFLGLESESSPHVRNIELVNIGVLASKMKDRLPAQAFLRRLIAVDPDSAVVEQAFKALRILDALGESKLFDDRVSALQAKAPDGAPDWLLREQERSRGLAMGVDMPAFMSDPPPPFAAMRGGTKASVRVLAFGDWGYPDSTTKSHAGNLQIAVAKAIREAHAKQPFDFGITLGDNFYGLGLPSPTNPRWRTQYESMYGPLGVPIYASLGNHDYYTGDSPAAEIAYSWHSPTWHLPSRYYTYTAGPVQFFAVDGNDLSPRQLSWLKHGLEHSSARWKVVYGHFPPYVTTAAYKGRHITEDSSMVATLVPVLRGRADMYVAGHSHTFQIFKPIDGVQYIIAGTGGAPLYAVDPDDKRLRYATATSGFATLVFSASTCKVTFTDTNGKALYSETLHK